MTHPDLLLTGGRAFTGVPERPFADVVAVRDGRIVAVGGDDLLDLRGPGTEVVDLAGGMLLPGFQDAHVHPTQGGVERLTCDLTPYLEPADYLDAIGRYATAHPSAPWITGGGWWQAAFERGVPTAAYLDAVVPDRPAFLVNRDHHGAWVNTAALRAAGIDASTPDPADGRIERDADGVPTGTLHEGAMALVGELIPPTTPEQQRAGLLEAQRYLHSLGVTAWQDALLGEYAGIADAADVYLSLVAEGLLTMRVVGALWWRRDRGVEQIDDLVARRERAGTGRFRATTVKIMQDGVPENFTAAMLEPYFDGCGCRTGNSGLSFVDPQVLREAVTRLDAEGFQVHTHAIGDRAVRETLDALQAAREANGGNDHRHHVAHVQVIDPVDLPRFADLGVAANLQMLWAVNEEQMTDLTVPYLGPERSDLQYPFASLAGSGARLCAGSDWPVSTPDPWQAIHVAVNRTAYGEQQAPFLPEQAIDLTTAITAYTAGTAWINHLDTETGTLEPGKVADLCVVDRDPFAGPPEEIGATRNLATYVEGVRVH